MSHEPERLSFGFRDQPLATLDDPSESQTPAPAQPISLAGPPTPGDDAQSEEESDQDPFGVHDVESDPMYEGPNRCDD